MNKDFVKKIILAMTSLAKNDTFSDEDVILFFKAWLPEILKYETLTFGTALKIGACEKLEKNIRRDALNRANRLAETSRQLGDLAVIFSKTEDRNSKVIVPEEISSILHRGINAAEFRGDALYIAQIWKDIRINRSIDDSIYEAALEKELEIAREKKTVGVGSE